MNADGRVSPGQLVADMLVQNAGGYLRTSNTTLRKPASTAPAYQAKQARCYQCDHIYAHRADVADILAFVAYGIGGTQSGDQLMRWYKQDNPPASATRVILLMLATAIVAHRACMATSTAGPPTAWCTVPSLRQDRVHPLTTPGPTTGHNAV